MAGKERSITRLDDRTGGRWSVHTDSSSYELDLDARTGVRIPGTAPQVRAARLRKDFETWQLLQLINCEVGRPMRLLIKGVAASGSPTVRTTTTVRSITAL